MLQTLSMGVSFPKPAAVVGPPEGVAVGVIQAGGCVVEPSPPGLKEAIAHTIASRAGTNIPPILAQIRTLLRHGRYKPTGRGKPASEYLLKAARGGRFPEINNLVDINNVISLRYLLPISLIDRARAEADQFVVRRGRPGERYVFNAGGQIIDVEDLLLLASLPADLPRANPVKDSLATKLNEQTHHVMAVVYAPVNERSLLEEATQEMAEMLSRWGRAQELTSTILPE